MPGPEQPGCGMATVLAALDRSDCRTPEALAAAGLDRRALVKAAGKLIARGFAERAERGCYRLTAEGEAFRASGATFTSGPNGRLTQVLRRPRRITLQDKLWRALRAAHKATLPDLLRLCDRADGAGAAGATRYLGRLRRAGYVRQLPRRDRASATAPTSNGFRVWLLVNDTGPLAPALRRGGGIHDRNLGVDVPEVAAISAGDAPDAGGRT